MPGDAHTVLRYCDLHCHLDFADNARGLVNDLNVYGVRCLSVTISPQGYERAKIILGECNNVRVGLGLHPWWVADGRCDETEVERFVALLAGTRFVGEVGLDFSQRHRAGFDVQLAAFNRVAVACAQGGKVLSLHAVRSAGQVLDVLERHDCFSNNACIFHWFSGTSEELQRAVRQGCYFSVSERMLASRRGRAYVQAIPTKRLVLETDLPEEGVGAVSASVLEASLQRAADALSAVRGERLHELVAATGAALLGEDAGTIV